MKTRSAFSALRTLESSATALLVSLSLLGVATPDRAAERDAHLHGAEVEERGRVVWVHDGDTVTVRLGTKNEHVRLIGVDAAELDDTRPEWHALAEQAQAYARSRLKGRDVVLLRDRLCADRDEFGRLLRYLILPGGDDFNLELIRKGHARAYTRFRFSRSREFSVAEREARASRVGRWAEGAAQGPPRLPRH